MNGVFFRKLPFKYIETLLMNTKKQDWEGKSFTYLIKYNDRIKMGYSNQLYDRFKTHYSVYGCAEILRLKEFHTTSMENKNKEFIEKLAKYNNNSYIHDEKTETTIIKTFDNLEQGKFKILDLD
tara:strand:- start:4301 stop:4672 length:372 start_codon:yes stop_codon:yes gene_type:complete